MHLKVALHVTNNYKQQLSILMSVVYLYMGWRVSTYCLSCYLD